MAFHILIGLFILYLLLMVYAYFFSDLTIFPIPPKSYEDKPPIIKIQTETGNNIAAIYLPNENAKYTLLVSHGNAEDLGTMIDFLLTLQAQGFSVFAYDYPGYGASDGKPSEKNSYAAAFAAYNYLVKHLHIPPNHIILFGQSLGTGIAIEVASHQSVAGIILQSPFLSAFRVLTQVPIFPFDKFNNSEKIKRIHTPIFIMHGTEDEIIPFWQGQKLFQEANSPKSFWPIEDAHHNDVLIVSGKSYWQKIKAFEEKLQ